MRKKTSHCVSNNEKFVDINNSNITSNSTQIKNFKIVSNLFRLVQIVLQLQFTTKASSISHRLLFITPDYIFLVQTILIYKYKFV